MRSLLLLLAIIGSLAAQSSVDLIHADYNSNRLIDGSIVSLLRGNVQFQYGRTNIKSDSTIWYRGSGVLRMGGRIRIAKPGQLITCDSLIFYSDIKKFILRGRTTMVDSSREVTLKSREADYFINEDSLELRQKPKVFFWDSKTKDTVVVTGEPMHYLGKVGLTRVRRNIQVEGPDLSAKANNGWYSRETKTAELNGRANMVYGLSTVSGGLIKLYLTEESVDSFTVTTDSPTGTSRDTSGRDTTVSKLTGDSLHFTVDGNRIKQVVSTKNAKFERFAPTHEGNADIVWGNQIITTIEKNGDGTAHGLKQVRALYRSDKDATNEVAGDDLMIFFDRDGAQEITLTGGVQGVILPK